MQKLKLFSPEKSFLKTESWILMNTSLDDKRKAGRLFSAVSQEGQAKKQWNKSNRLATHCLVEYLPLFFPSHSLTIGIVTPPDFLLVRKAQLCSSCNSKKWWGENRCVNFLGQQLSWVVFKLLPSVLLVDYSKKLWLLILLFSSKNCWWEAKIT